jgi:hypothetical protein
MYMTNFSVNYHDRREWNDGFQPDRKRGLIWYTHMVQRKMKALGLECGYGKSKKLSYSPGQQTTVFEAEVYTIKACVIENAETEISIFKLQSKHTFQLLDQLKTSLGLSLVKLAEINSSTDMGARVTDELRVMKLVISWQDWGLHVL